MGITKEQGKYRARITHMGKRHHVGSYKTELAAKRAITRFKKKLEEQDSFFVKDRHALEDFRTGLEHITDDRTRKQKILDMANASKSRLTKIAGRIKKWKR